MKSGINFLFMTTVFGVCASQLCENHLLKSLQNDACYIDCATSNDYFKDLNATYSIDIESGVLVTKFTLPPLNFCHSEYEIQLLVNEEIEDEFHCLKNKVFREIHSLKSYKMKKCENENGLNKSMSRQGMVAFNYIFSGCYKLKIKPHRGLSSCPTLYANKAYLETNFTKSYMPNVSFHYQYSSLWNDLHMKFMMETNISMMKVEFSHFENHSIVYKQPIIIKEQIDNENFICKPKIIWDPKKCSNVYQSVDCTFHGISPGNYSIFVSIEDDRCRRYTLWTKSQKCTWKNKIVCNKLPMTLPIILSSHDINIVSAVGIVGSSTLLITLLVLLIFKRKRINLSQKQDENNQEIIPLKRSEREIILLYPRDCKPFMKAMDSFKIFLSAFKNVKVHDCYSEEIMENGPFQSLLNQMSQPKSSIIIVDTHCGYLQQESMKLSSFTLNHSFYRDPTFMDSIFKYGLKLIMEDVSSEIYQKYYVIGFGGFSDNKCELVLPTSLRRYIIPNHLEKLLSDLKIANSNEHFIVNSPEYIILMEDIKSLADFKSRNPYYLESIVNLV